MNYFANYAFPKTTFEHHTIRQLGSQLIHKTQGAIASRDLLKWPAPTFSEGLSAIEEHFGLRNDRHFFHALPIKWANFHEPQITKGFEYFLNQDNEDGKGKRIEAFLRTFGINQFDENSNFQIEAEAQVGQGKRIDLQILWDSSNKIKEALIIEAKFGHIVTNDQLAGYDYYVLNTLKIQKEKLNLFVLSPGSKAQHSLAVAKTKKWKETTWFRFLLSYENILPKLADSDEFRRFRRTVWLRAST